MLTQGARPALQPMPLGFTRVPAPEKVKPRKVRSRCGAERLCDQAYPQQHRPFSLLSVTSQQMVSSADNTAQDRNAKAGSTQGSVAVATLARKMRLSSTT